MRQFGARRPDSVCSASLSGPPCPRRACSCCAQICIASPCTPSCKGRREFQPKVTPRNANGKLARLQAKAQSTKPVPNTPTHTHTLTLTHRVRHLRKVRHAAPFARHRLGHQLRMLRNVDRVFCIMRDGGFNGETKSRTHKCQVQDGWKQQTGCSTTTKQRRHLMCGIKAP